MARYTKRQYTVQVTAIMAAYVLLMLFEWPLALRAPAGWGRLLLSLVPALPVIVVIALMARFVMGSDELEQRIHLIALSIATAVVSAACVIVGFLAFADVLVVHGQIIFWVFPALCIVYGVARVMTVRRYTGSWQFWAC